MFLYSDHIGSRHIYVARLLEDRLGVPFHWVDDMTYVQSDTSVIVYSDKPVEGRYSIFNSGFLSENELRETSPEFDGIPFPAKEGFDMSFDLFGAVFFIVSRYEEYFPANTDKHGRFNPEESMLFKQGCLHRPVVDEWIFEFGQILEKQLEVQLNLPAYRFKPSFDIDVAYAYKGRPFWLTLAGYVKDIADRNFKGVKERFRVNTGLQTDPYDVYDKLRSLCADTGAKPIFFFQLGVRDTFDKNLYPLQPLMQALMDEINDWADTGIHPSYRSNTNSDSLDYEFSLYEKILGVRPEKSRQHYLKLSFPETFQGLDLKGIKDEYSLGYSHHYGFRAGTCHTFPFFDLSTNTMTELRIKPFMFMDGTLKDQLALSPVEAMHIIDELVQQVKQNHGEFIFIWHNSALSSIGEWQSWTEVLEYVFKRAAR